MDRGNDSDRERLSGVHRTEQTESKVNEDFLEWLKTKGPSWLLAGLIILVAYLAWIQLGERRAASEREAWTAFNESRFSGLPASYEDVADRYGSIGKLGTLSRLEAGRLYLQAVRTGRPFDAEFRLPDEDDDADERITEEDRDHYLNQADRAFRAVLDRDDGSDAMALHAVTALNGLAAVAEARGEIDGARGFYERAAERAEDRFPALARQAHQRAETVGELPDLDDFPTRQEIEARRDLRAADDELPRPLTIEESLRDFLLD